MDLQKRKTDIGMSITGGCLIVQLTVELYDDLMESLQMTILNRVNKESLKGLVLDLSSLQVIDSYTCNLLIDTIKMVHLLGIQSIVIGLQPGIVASIIDLDVDIKSIRTALNLEDAIGLINGK